MPPILPDLPWWSYILLTLGLTHVTIAAVTIFLHRHQAHRALTLHPLAGHFFRFWLWLTTGMVTREWVAIHRKHHAKCETTDDPHSPQVFGIRRVLLEGTELYRREARNADTVARYGQGTPDDWLERHVYQGHPAAGIAALLVIEVVVLGPLGLTVWAVQMLWIPVFAAGIINGLGHYWGYRHFATRDASRNIVPWGILIGGEELHNNHHAYSTSARLSNRRWEFDIGWTYIRVLAALRLARVLRTAPPLRLRPPPHGCDLGTVQAIITHRFAVLANYAHALQRTALAEIEVLRGRAASGIDESRTLAALRHWLHSDAHLLPPPERDALARALHGSTTLRTIYTMRRELSGLWKRSAASKDELLRHLEAWCQRAEASGIGALEEFARTLRRYG